ncbi:flagellar hook-basal body complex protein [Ligilactobacillus sp. WILCCON 0076]|uniref:Flagellar hook-basal body complex protein n=1 Tax=Ligilactobacillus ubinensis TaxID=2876789 RepID=A0A9X2FIL5_9LACO|nr:flagellar hook-basal body complex protein [Ligilactobacillus ubinensis]MCP0886235.1 flagellar hook-basal body complex protein [Ligilactobacillus ubinensis]
MIRGLDTLRADFNVLQDRQQNLASNIANVNTSGYQQKELFQSAMDDVSVHNYENGPLNNQYNQLTGGITWQNEISGSRVDTSQGSLEKTGLSTDYAINGNAYFAVQNNSGQTIYTKNGNFTTNADNQLTTQDGYLVLNQNGEAIDADTTNPQFLVVSFNDDNSAVNLGDTYYSTTGGVTQVTNPDVMQGYLTSSNVSMTDAITQMMETTREFQSSQQVLSATNTTLDKAVNTLGKA